MSPSMEYWITYPRECNTLCLLYSKSNPVIEGANLKLETGGYFCWDKVKCTWKLAVGDIRNTEH